MKNTLKALCLLLALMLSFGALAETPTLDRAGNAIAVPEEVKTIVCLAPSTMQILEALGVKDAVVAVDTQSPLYVEGLDALPQIDMMSPDIEALAALQADLVLASGISYLDGNPFAQLTQLGICVAEIPTSDRLASIQEDIRFIAACIGREAEGEALVADMQQQIDVFAAIGQTITEKKRVLFEISALPYIYSFGKGTFLHEILEILGAENVFGDVESWIAVSEEDAVLANPDVILTSVNYLDDPVGEILSRAGWESVNAVANGRVYAISNGTSSLPNHHVVDAMREMALAIDPEAYAELAQ